MTEPLLRNLTLVLPALAVVAAVVARARAGGLPQRVPAAVLATLLSWVGVLAVEVLGDWWRFDNGPSSVLGMPLETSLGWALAWGALPVLAGGRPLLWWLGLLWLDVTLVPHLEPLVHLGPAWLVGEGLLLGVVAAPALALGHLTATGRRLGVRVVLQGATFAALVGWAAPTLALAQDGLGWADVLDHGFVVRGAFLAAAVVLAVPALSAVAELWRVGGGTPFPWDPPRRLVTTGPYAYLHNPMQTAVVGLLALLAAAAGSVTLAVGVGVAVGFSLAVAEPHERMVLGERWEGHGAYHRTVRGWVPRWRPVPAEPSILWVSETCGMCRTTGAAVRRLGPTCLDLRDAEGAPVHLTRMRWAGAGTHDSGVAALARALERTTLPWAWLGWLVRLPLVRPAVQVVADACGLGPRELPARVRTVSP